MPQPAVTVKELIVLLMAEPLDAVVVLEGCDCAGPMGSLRYQSSDHTLLLERGASPRLTMETWSV